MPSLIGNYVAANYRQQIVPFSRFGTRKVAWYAIRHANLNDGAGYLNMPLFNAIIDAIQTRAEIVMVGAPHVSSDWGKFMVAVFEDTFNDGPNNDISGVQAPNTKATTLQDAIQLVAGENAVEVQRFYLAGAPATNHNNYDGFSDSSEYKEFDTKIEYEEGSYLSPTNLL